MNAAQHRRKLARDRQRARAVVRVKVVPLRIDRITLTFLGRIAKGAGVTVSQVVSVLLAIHVLRYQPSPKSSAPAKKK